VVVDEFEVGAAIAVVAVVAVVVDGGEGNIEAGCDDEGVVIAFVRIDVEIEGSYRCAMQHR